MLLFIPRATHNKYTVWAERSGAYSNDCTVLRVFSSTLEPELSAAMNVKFKVTIKMQFCDLEWV